MTAMNTEYLVIKPINFPSSKGDKTYSLIPGTAIAPTGREGPDGIPFWSMSGWWESRPLDLTGQQDSLVDLRAFFEEVAELGGGQFQAPVTQDRVFTLLFPTATVSVYVAHPKKLRADVDFEIAGKEDWTIPLTVQNFMDPNSFYLALGIEENLMGPASVAATLRKIAARIDASSSPRIELVSRDLRKLIASLTE